MKMRLIIVMAFLTAMTAGVAGAGWTYWGAMPQKFQVHDDYVIAVGKVNKLEPVQASDVLTALQAGKEIRLAHAEIQGDLRFNGEVKNDVHFEAIQFTGDVDFRDAKFTGNANFVSAQFKGNADFRDAKFTGNANFRSAQFKGYASFRSAQFTKEVDFRGVLENILYNEVFYLMLIKKYKERGWLNEADYAYYDYRQKKRKNRNILSGGAELVFLEIPFGYGVKPWILLRSFLCLWLPFSLYYLGFLRRPGEWCFGNGIRPWYPFRDKWRCLVLQRWFQVSKSLRKVLRRWERYAR